MSLQATFSAFWAALSPSVNPRFACWYQTVGDVDVAVGDFDACAFVLRQGGGCRLGCVTI
jgi:hypothetical protein